MELFVIVLFDCFFKTFSNKVIITSTVVNIMVSFPYDKNQESVGHPERKDILQIRAKVT